MTTRDATGPRGHTCSSLLSGRSRLGPATCWWRSRPAGPGAISRPGGQAAASTFVRADVPSCDRNGATVPLIKTVTMPAAAFANGPVRINVARRQGRYLRVEVHDADGVLL